MKNITKIFTGVAILFLLLGFASATDVNNLKVPDGWKAIGGGSYHEEGISPGSGTGQNMMIQKWYYGLKDEFYSNITEEQYVVIDKGDNTFMFSDGMNKNSGSFEVVEIDGEKYFVLFTTVDDLDAKEVSKTYQFMTEFNGLNNFKPVPA